MRRLTILLALLFLCPTTLPQPADPLPFTPGELQDLFAQYNATYWDGKLPKNTVVVWTAFTDHRYGDTIKEDSGRFVIRLDVTKNREANVSKTTMLHEMAHVKTWEHNNCHQLGVKVQNCNRWLSELHRIMLEGAFDDLV